jgi:hypothetical protein
MTTSKSAGTPLSSQTDETGTTYGKTKNTSSQEQGSSKQTETAKRKRGSSDSGGSYDGLSRKTNDVKRQYVGLEYDSPGQTQQMDDPFFRHNDLALNAITQIDHEEDDGEDSCSDTEIVDPLVNEVYHLKKMVSYYQDRLDEIAEVCSSKGYTQRERAKKYEEIEILMLKAKML